MGLLIHVWGVPVAEFIPDIFPEWTSLITNVNIPSNMSAPSDVNVPPDMSVPSDVNVPPEINGLFDMNVPSGVEFNQSAVDDWKMNEVFNFGNPIQHQRSHSRTFRLQFDLRQFKPEEIMVRTSGHTLTVTARHLDLTTQRSREFHRSYMLPRDIRPESLMSKLSADGILTIEAPVPTLEGPRDKLVPIQNK